MRDQGDDPKATLSGGFCSFSEALLVVCLGGADGSVPVEPAGQICPGYSWQEPGERLGLWNCELLPQYQQYV